MEFRIAWHGSMDAGLREKRLYTTGRSASGVWSNVFLSGCSNFCVLGIIVRTVFFFLAPTLLYNYVTVQDN